MLMSLLLLLQFVMVVSVLSFDYIFTSSLGVHIFLSWIETMTTVDEE